MAVPGAAQTLKLDVFFLIIIKPHQIKAQGGFKLLFSDKKSHLGLTQPRVPWVPCCSTACGALYPTAGLLAVGEVPAASFVPLLALVPAAPTPALGCAAPARLSPPLVAAALQGAHQIKALASGSLFPQPEQRSLGRGL